MKNHSDMEVDFQLIGKYLAGEATPDEALAIGIWRKKYPENNQAFESAARIWEESSKEYVYHQPRVADEWKKLKKNIEKERMKPTSLLNSSTFLRWKIAAAFLILLGAAIVFYMLYPRTTPAIYSNVIHAEEDVIKDTLKDATAVSLFRNSRLSVQNQFAVKGREVKLEGEACFSVAQLPDQPFIIHTGGIEIIVLGTIFNVKDDSEKVTVSVRKGRVRMQKNTTGIVVPAGSTGAFYKTNRQFALYSDSLNVNEYSYVAGELYFNNVSMAEVKEAIEHTYNVKVKFKDESLAGLRINTHFKKQSLDYVAEVISASLGIQYDLKNDTLYFYQKDPQ